MYEEPDFESHTDGDPDGLGCFRGVIAMMIVTGSFVLFCLIASLYW